LFGAFEKRYQILICIIVEILAEYPHANLDRTFKRLLRIVEEFSKHEISFGTLKERQESKKYFKGNIPQRFSNATLIVDSTPISIQKSEFDTKHGENGVWCEKTKSYGNLVSK
jgi:hypothetical protein